MEKVSSDELSVVALIQSPNLHVIPTNNLELCKHKRTKREMNGYGMIANN